MREVIAPMRLRICAGSSECSLLAEAIRTKISCTGPYNFYSLAEKLRSLFTLFAGHIISHAANMLENNNISKTSKLLKIY